MAVAAVGGVVWQGGKVWSEINYTTVIKPEKRYKLTTDFFIYKYHLMVYLYYYYYYTYIEYCTQINKYRTRYHVHHHTFMFSQSKKC